MNAPEQLEQARLALEVYRASEKLQSTLLHMYLSDFRTIDEMEQCAVDRAEELPF